MLARLAGLDRGSRLPRAGAELLHRMAELLGVEQSGQAFRETLSDAATLVPVAAAAPGGSILSSREREVLARIAAGDSNKLIARAFALSPHTVKRHVANILDKTGSNTRGQAAAWYLGHR